MSETRSITVTLPADLVDALHARVEAGEYASESEVVRDGLRALPARDLAIEIWLREKVVPEYDRVLAGESEGASSDELRARLGL